MVGLFASWMHDEGKLVVITEQMPLMRSLLDFQLAVRVLHWDGNIAVTGSLCDITSSPCCHSSCNHPTESVPQGEGKPHLFPLMGIHGAFFHAKEKKNLRVHAFCKEKKLNNFQHDFTIIAVTILTIIMQVVHVNCRKIYKIKIGKENTKSCS